MKDGYLIDSPAPGKYLPVDPSSSLPASKFYLPDDLPPAIDLSADVVEAHRRAKLLLRLRESYRERYADAAPSVRALAGVLFVEPVFTVSRAAELIDMTYPAANSAVSRLVADDVLEERTGKERYREFQAPEVLDVLNRDADEIPSPGELIAE
jgi:hypothetical protein